MKLLFCVNMFNEGMVILLRPMGSPIIDKQQTELALMAGKQCVPLILNMANTTERLYSIYPLGRKYWIRCFGYAWRGLRNWY